VALARSLIMDPDILLMDEPFGAIDAQTRVVLQAELLQIWERTKKTVLFVTHSVEEALYLSDRVFVLSNRPSRVREVIDVDLPRPRDPEAIVGTPRYGELHNRIWTLLQQERRGDGGDG
jgi:NitT/TauT family transport system ATP-binding protein